GARAGDARRCPGPRLRRLLHRQVSLHPMAYRATLASASLREEPHMRHLIAIALLIGLIVSSAGAQALSDHVPGDAIIYVGWRGTDALGATYDNSHLAAVIAGTNFAGLSEQTIPALLSKLPQEKPEEIERAAAIEAAIPLLLHLWKRPTAFFVAPK